MAVTVSFLCTAIFVLNDPWMTRDGCFLCRLADSYPCFILAPGLAWYAGWVGRKNRPLRRTAIIAAVAFLVWPVTWSFAERVVTTLVPIAIDEYRLWLK